MWISVHLLHCIACLVIHQFHHLFLKSFWKAGYALTEHNMWSSGLFIWQSFICLHWKMKEEDNVYDLWDDTRKEHFQVFHFVILCSLDNMKTRYEIQDETNEISTVLSAYFLFYKIFQKWFTHVRKWFAHVWQFSTLFALNGRYFQVCWSKFWSVNPRFNPICSCRTLSTW